MLAANLLVIPALFLFLVVVWSEIWVWLNDRYYEALGIPPLESPDITHK